MGHSEEQEITLQTLDSNMTKIVNLLRRLGDSQDLLSAGYSKSETDTPRNICSGLLNATIAVIGSNPITAIQEQYMLIYFLSSRHKTASGRTI